MIPAVPFASTTLSTITAGSVAERRWRSAPFERGAANKYFLEYNRAYDNPEVFFLTSPEEMEEDAKRIGLKVLKNCGLDFFFAQSAINRMDEEQFMSYMQLADKLSESPSCTGLADHALLICRK